MALINVSIVGLMVEFKLAKLGVRVRFPNDVFLLCCSKTSLELFKCKLQFIKISNNFINDKIRFNFKMKQKFQKLLFIGKKFIHKE